MMWYGGGGSVFRVAMLPKMPSSQQKYKIGKETSITYTGTKAGNINCL